MENGKSKQPWLIYFIIIIHNWLVHDSALQHVFTLISHKKRKHHQEINCILCSLQIGWCQCSEKSALCLTIQHTVSKQNKKCQDLRKNEHFILSITRCLSFFDWTIFDDFDTECNIPTIPSTLEGTTNDCQIEATDRNRIFDTARSEVSTHSSFEVWLPQIKWTRQSVNHC